MKVPRAITDLIEAFERLPGIGPKTAARLTYYLLHVPDGEIEKFSEAIGSLKKNTVMCSSCFNISETDPCSICDDKSRDRSVICVVEQPLDVLAFERTGKFSGLYHVLHGAISPINNIGPDEIRINELMVRLQNNKEEAKELVLATNPNMEGEATAMYIEREISKLKASLKLSADGLKDKQDSHVNPDGSTVQAKLEELEVTRLAYGLPTGADIEYADEMTLSRAFEGRRKF